MSSENASLSPDAKGRADTEAEPAAAPVAWLKEWISDGEPRSRVDRAPAHERWLDLLNPTITPLYRRSGPDEFAALAEAARQFLAVVDQEGETFFRCEACGHQHDNIKDRIDLWLMTDDFRAAVAKALRAATARPESLSVPQEEPETCSIPQPTKGQP